ncbi:MAG: hypothetical protein HRU27_15300 [Rhizobiaceae bacterium]|nr:hypothetical protein [Hyphomicrobiales bacterium]NRB31955.1 hypothetical protein [Rhizobiaceae bacterium]
MQQSRQNAHTYALNVNFIGSNSDDLANNSVTMDVFGPMSTTDRTKKSMFAQFACHCMAMGNRSPAP